MPKTYRDTTGFTTKYEKVSEFPANARQLVGQFSSLGVDNVKEMVYSEFIPYEGEDDEAHNELDIDIEVDAEDAARNKPLGFKVKLENELRNVGRYLNIDYVYIYARYTNKESFAKKFLKQLKAHLKTTEYGPKIHSIGFNPQGVSTPEIKVTKKRESWSVSNSKLKEAIEEYLSSVGYPNIKIYVVN
jgi:hypothetical protein